MNKQDNYSKRGNSFAKQHLPTMELKEEPNLFSPCHARYRRDAMDFVRFIRQSAKERKGCERRDLPMLLDLTASLETAVKNSTISEVKRAVLQICTSTYTTCKAEIHHAALQLHGRIHIP